ncbi:MAG TPA: PPC domain-containing protein [Kofleriaceae bacterium]|nr:PPC domain-containing protein [Kofleriaceae bacterium]
MMTFQSFCKVAGVFAGVSMIGCQMAPATQVVGDGDRTKVGIGKADTSVEAVFVDFEFDAELVTSFAWNPRSQIEDQLLFTIGHLNGEQSVGRLDRLEVTNITTTDEDGKTRIAYHAKMPVAWGDRDVVPTSYDLTLPLDVSFEGQQAFTDKYNHDCVDFGAHDVDTGSMWYYYRPNAFRCELDPADVITVTADVTISDINTTGKFPEYNKVWEDGTLNVVAVFGKYEDGATSSSDAGISAYNEFTREVGDFLGQFDLQTTPAEVPRSPGVDAADITFEATLDDGRRIVVTTLLVDNVRTAGFDFTQRYEALSPTADIIAYNGHAGLGSNIRALAQKGQWQTGQYAIVFMNGCDTYAYVDAALADAHSAVNTDDPNGTKYLDIVTNAMPAFFHSDSEATMALVRGLTNIADPQTYEQIFRNIDSSQVVLVSGEQDNEFVPGSGDDDDNGDDSWTGLDESGTVAADEEHRFVTPTLAAGSYTFSITGTNDSDLYVRIGQEPTTSSFDCRPFRTGSNETCVVDLPAASVVHVMVRGWAQSSDYELVGTAN